MTKPDLVVLRHRLNFKREDSQFVHHPRHTVRNHTQVFCTAKHTCSLRQTWQFFHSLIIPELVISTIEIVIIEAVEIIFLTLTKFLVVFIILNGDTWVPAVFSLMINQEKLHVTVNSIGFYFLTTKAQSW